MECDSIFEVVYLHRKLLLVLGRSSGSTSCALSAGPPHQTSERGGACSGTGSPRCLSSSLGFAECPEGGSTVYKLFFTCVWELRCLWGWILDIDRLLSGDSNDSLTQLTVKRPYFDTLFQKTVFFSKIFFGKPPSKFLEVCLNSEYMW